MKRLSQLLVVRLDRPKEKREGFSVDFSGEAGNTNIDLIVDSSNFLVFYYSLHVNPRDCFTLPIIIN